MEPQLQGFLREKEKMLDLCIIRKKIDLGSFEVWNLKKIFQNFSQLSRLTKNLYKTVLKSQKTSF